MYRGRRIRRRIAGATALTLFTVGACISFTASPAAAAPVTAASTDGEAGSLLPGTRLFSSVNVIGTTASQPIHVDIAEGAFISIDVDIEPRTGGSLSVGTFDAVASTADATHEGLRFEIVVPGPQTCPTTSTGRLIIDDLAFGGGGIQRFSARYEYRCAEAGDETLFGAISFNSSSPYRAVSYTPSSGVLPAFGVTASGMVSGEQVVSVFNFGPSNLAFGTPMFSGPDASQFSLAPPEAGSGCQDLTPVDSSCRWLIVFAPTGSPGTRSATVTFFDDYHPSGGTGRDYQLTGVVGDAAATVDWEPGALGGAFHDFATVAPTHVTTNEIWLRASRPGHEVNMRFGAPSGQDLVVGEYQVVLGQDRPLLAVSIDNGGCGGISGRFTIDELSFAGPGQLASFSARFEQRCNSATPQPTLFGAVSYQASAPFRSRTVTPSVAAFGEVAAGTTSSPIQVTVTNNGPDDLSLAGASLSGSHVSQFSLQSTCASSVLTSGQSCVMSVTFSPPPDELGARSATLTFYDDLSPSSGLGRRVGLTGTAVDPTGEFTPVSPVRLLDTRLAGGPLGPNTIRHQQVTGAAGLPSSGISALVVNVTAVTPTATSYVTVFPKNAANQVPLASNLNVARGVNRPNLVTVRVGDDGQISLYNNAGSVHLVLDVAGYYADSTGPAGSRYHAVNPERLMNTRSGPNPGAIGPGAAKALDVTTGGTVPSNATAVVMNVAVFKGTAPSFLTIYPDDVARPTVANLNFTANLTVANLVTVRIPPSGVIRFYNGAGTVQVAADLVGYYDGDKSTEAGRFVPIDPVRTLNTRDDGLGPVGPDEAVGYWFTGPGSPLASDATALLVNTTVFGPPTNAGFLTAFPWDAAEIPLASNINFYKGQVIPNLIIVRLSTGTAFGLPAGSAGFYNSPTSFIQIVGDVGGWFTGPSGTSGLDASSAEEWDGAPRAQSAKRNVA